jgi:hypothetical protein
MNTLEFVRGALVGIGVVVIGCMAWSLFVLVRSWVDGDLARTFPDCDPCGFMGYAGRMAILSGMALAILGVPAAAVGWLVETILYRRAPSNQTVTNGPTARHP